MLARLIALHFVFLVIMVLPLTTIPAVAQESDQPFQVGVARVDITPFYPVRLNGFGSRRAESEGVSQKLWAKALAITDGDKPPCILLTIDSLGIRESMVNQVAEALFDQFQIPRQQIALTFTHTHCAPKVNGASDTIFSSPIPMEHQLHIDRYTDELPQLLIQAACNAIESQQPATLEWQSGKATFAANRRATGGPVDHDLPVLLARDANGSPFAIYTSYACHCVTLSFNQYSGDWAGYAQESIEQLFPGTTALVSIGCGSDSNPVSGVTGDRIDVADGYGKQVGNEVQRLFKKNGTQLAGPLTAHLDWISIPLNTLPTREALETLSKQGGATGFNADWQLEKLNRGETLTSELSYPVQSFTFGNQLQMVFLAGEVCADYSLRLKKELNRDHLWVNGYSNDFCAYIPSERLLREGGYGGGGEIPYFALPTTLKPGLEQKIIDAVKLQTPDIFHLPIGTQGVPPKSPEESLRLMETHDDLQIELVAAEPLVADPVAIDFGSDGRLWVAEMPDYSRGVNDTFEPQGRVRVLSDTNGDGQFDTSDIFITGLRFPTDVKVWRDGVLICDAPDVIFAADRNGDGVAEVREVLLSGFATHNPHARVNSLRFGWDGWIYGSGGLFGGQISSPNQRNVDTANRDFRFNPDTGMIESATGQTQQGRTRDDFGNWFGCTNSALLLHYPLDERYAVRAPGLRPPRTIVPVPTAAHGQRLFPPTDLVLFQLSGAPGWPTSACGAEIYRDQQLGESYYGDAFVCEPVNQLVHRLKLNRNQQGQITGDREPREFQSEFLRSADQWFRPVQARTGTDGALYVVDMYRYVIEHSQWIPEQTRAELNMLAGQDRGRIYRISRRGQPPLVRPNLDKMTPREVAKMMGSTNGPVRDLVQQKLIWERSGEAEPAAGLVQVAREGSWPAAKLQAIATLAANGQLTVNILIDALESGDPESRRALIQIGESLIPESRLLRASITNLSIEAPPEVKVQIAFSSSGFPSSERIALLKNLLDQSDSPWLEYAALTALTAQDAGAMWGQLERMESPVPFRRYRSLVQLATSDPLASSNLVERILSPVAKFSVPVRWQLLAEWLRSSSPDSRRETAGLDHRIAGNADAAMQVLQRDQVNDDTKIAALELIIALANPTSAPFQRRPSTRELEAISGLLGIQSTPNVQSIALQALAALSPTDKPPLFLEQWETSSPGLRNEMIDVVLTRPDWVGRLLEMIVNNKISAKELNATQREKLTTLADQDLIELSKRAFASLGTSTRTEVLQQWKSALELSGTFESGRGVFGKHCAACHLLDGVGNQVGPDLAALTDRTPTSMLVAILDPNRDIDSRYLNFIALTLDGRTLSGLMVEETAVSVTLKEREGKTHLLLRRDLELLRSGNLSAMPEGIEKDFSKQELADLIAYLVPPRVPPKTFAGNAPRLITANDEGQFELLASQAEIYGTDIVFESDSPFQNIGYWHGLEDRAAWNLECGKPGRFDVFLDYASPPDSSGNQFAITVGTSRLVDSVASTGAWSEYRLHKTGTVDLAPGTNRIDMGFHGERVAPALLDLRRIVLKPAPSK